MQKITYKWKNLGQIKDTEVSKIKVTVDAMYPNILIKFKTQDYGGYSVKDWSFTQYKNAEILEKLRQINIPDPATMPQKGLGETAWEIAVDRVRLKGNLSDEPEFVKEIKQVIHFDEVLAYVQEQAKKYKSS